MTRNIKLKIQLKLCGTFGSQALMHLSRITYSWEYIHDNKLTPLAQSQGLDN